VKKIIKNKEYTSVDCVWLYAYVKVRISPVSICPVSICPHTVYGAVRNVNENSFWRWDNSVRWQIVCIHNVAQWHFSGVVDKLKITCVKFQHDSVYQNCQCWFILLSLKNKKGISFLNHSVCIRPPHVCCMILSSSHYSFAGNCGNYDFYLLFVFWLQIMLICIHLYIGHHTNTSGQYFQRFRRLPFAIK